MRLFISTLALFLPLVQRCSPLPKPHCSWPADRSCCLLLNILLFFFVAGKRCVPNDNERKQDLATLSASWSPAPSYSAGFYRQSLTRPPYRCIASAIRTLCTCSSPLSACCRYCDCLKQNAADGPTGLFMNNGRSGRRSTTCL